MRIRVTTLCLTLGLILPLVLLAPAVAQDIPGNLTSRHCVAPEGSSGTRPDPEGVPTKITVYVYMIDISNINNVTQSFTSDFVLITTWQDPRLARKPSNTETDVCWLNLKDVWHPVVEVFNKSTAVNRLDEVVEVQSDGTVILTQRFYGNLVTSLNLREFPFDHQRLPITLVSFLYGPKEVKFIFGATGGNNDFSVSDWSVTGGGTRSGVLTTRWEHEGTTGQSKPFNETYARFDYTMIAKRYVGYYAWKVIVPLTIIVCMSWAVFWIDPGQLGVQIGVASTSILTLIAFLFSLGRILPPISYLTHIDYFVYASLSLVFLAFAEALTTCTLAAQDHMTLARRIDLCARGVFPAAFVTIQFLFWL